MNRDWKTIPEMVFAQGKAHPHRCVMKAKKGGMYQEITWGTLLTQVEETALGLLDLGVQPGDRVAILSESRPEWAITDLSILSVGGATVPIYTTLSSPEIEYILRDSQVQLLFLSSPEAMAKILPFQRELDIKMVLFDAPYRVSGPRIWWLGELMGLGRTAAPQTKKALYSRIANVRQEDLASVIYTSGTTGHPKGVMLTHKNFLSNCRAVGEVLPVTEKDENLSFLPLSHVFERTAGYYFVLSVGGTVAYAENLEAVPSNLLEIRPTILTAVPRFYEKMRERIQQAVREASIVKRLIFRWAFEVGTRRIQYLSEHQAVPWGISLQFPIADRLVFSHLRQRLGGRIRFCVSGSAPLARDLAELFAAAGILILEGYGLTETSPVISVNRPDRFKLGSVGLALPGVEVKIAEDGEILTRGPHVMKGYFNKPEATAEVLDSEGWFHTGDIGTIDEQGFLFITDRKKDLIKTSGGKMVAPQNLENALKKEPLIEDCVVIGDRRKYITALIVPNPAGIKEFAARKHLPTEPWEALLKHPEITALVWERVVALNKVLAPFEQLKKITLLPAPFTMASGELTPTLKVKRKVVGERYAAQIESMYKDS